MNFWAVVNVALLCLDRSQIQRRARTVFGLDASESKRTVSPEKRRAAVLALISRYHGFRSQRLAACSIPMRRISMDTERARVSGLAYSMLLTQGTETGDDLRAFGAIGLGAINAARSPVAILSRSAGRDSALCDGASYAVEFPRWRKAELAPGRKDKHAWGNQGIVVQTHERDNGSSSISVKSSTAMLRPLCRKILLISPPFGRSCSSPEFAESSATD